MWDNTSIQFLTQKSHCFPGCVTICTKSITSAMCKWHISSRPIPSISGHKKAVIISLQRWRQHIIWTKSQSLIIILPKAAILVNESIKVKVRTSLKIIFFVKSPFTFVCVLDMQLMGTTTKRFDASSATLLTKKDTKSLVVETFKNLNALLNFVPLHGRIYLKLEQRTVKLS